MEEVGAQLGSAVVALTFLWAGITKVIRAERWRQDIRAYRLPRPVRALGFVSIPWTEIGIAVAMATGRANIGAVLALGLLAVFSFAIVRARILQGTNKLLCGCFGGSAARDYRLMLLRNVTVGSVAAAILLTFDGNGTDDRVFPVPSDLLPASLVALGIVAILWTLRQANAHIRELRDARP
jgi:methylamine utilization protein MauE